MDVKYIQAQVEGSLTSTLGTARFESVRVFCLPSDKGAEAPPTVAC